MTLKERLHLEKDPVFLMDGTAYIYRSFYANRHLQRADGFPTNAILLVSRILLRILREERPKYFLFAMDGKGEKFRNTIYEAYKANREAMPEDLALQIEPIIEMTKALGCKVEITEKFEADDCIASLASRFSENHPVIIISGDKDLKQCLRSDVFMWDPGSKEEHLLTMADFEKENGVTPQQWPEVQALIGDSSDNIPGVPGIGPKTAKQIFQICPSLHDIETHLDRLPVKIQDKLKPHLAEMYKWRDLTTLKTDECANLTLQDLRVANVDLAACSKLIKEYELNSLKRDVDSLMRSELTPLTVTKQEQKSAIEQTVWPTPDSIIVDSAKNLPVCADKTVAVIWPGAKNASASIAIGKPLQDETQTTSPDYVWKGAMSELCEWLKAADTVIVSDLKSLIRDSVSWRELLKEKGVKHFFDLGLASYLLSPEDGDYSWARLSLRWKDELPADNPALLALAMGKNLVSDLKIKELYKLYEDLELPLVQVLAQMEEVGFAIDPAKFQSFLDEVSAEINRLTMEIYEQAGMEFNIRSSQQVGDVLYGKLNLSSTKKTKGGRPSTSQQTLEKLAANNPIVDNILQFKKLDKVRSTYLDPLPRLMDANNRIHTTFNQKATATGRLSSSNPNLQNIPVSGILGQRMRGCFIAGPGNLLVAADYSQIELRVLAHMSQDQTLLDAFTRGQDIHAATAALVFDTAPDQIKPDQRRMAKTINFGLLYGMGAQKLSQELRISTASARDFINRYFEKLTQLKAFYEKILESAHEKGYVSTMSGRRRWLPELYSANNQDAAQAKRQAVNAVIQGTAADIIKIAMLNVAANKELKELDAKLVLQVHDELLLEAPKDNAQQAGAIVADIMSSVKPNGQPLTVPLLVEWGASDNWAQAH